MMKPRSLLSAYLLKVLLWAPLCFIGWYFLSEQLLVPVRWVSEYSLRQFIPGGISALEQHGIRFELVTRYQSSLLAGHRPGDAVGLITFNIDALKYCYGTPLFAAMTLAVPGSFKIRLSCLLLGVIALIPVQCWGVVSDALATLSFKLGNGVAAQLGFNRLLREAIALGYQLGYLILPSLVPIILWGLLNRSFLRQMAPNLIPKGKNPG